MPNGRKLQLKCLKKWFYRELPRLQKISKLPIIEKIYHHDINSLGMEGAYEEVERLFRHGVILVVAKDINNFVISGIFGTEVYLIYELEKGKIIRR